MQILENFDIMDNTFNGQISKYSNYRVFILMALMHKYEYITDRSFVRDRDNDLIDLIDWLNVTDSVKEPKVLNLISIRDYNYFVSNMAFLIGCSVRYMQLQYILYQATFMPIRIED